MREEVEGPPELGQVGVGLPFSSELRGHLEPGTFGRCSNFILEKQSNAWGVWRGLL